MERLLDLPEPPRALCFSPEDLVCDSFAVDGFVSSCRHHASLETLRTDLGVYFNKLKSALIELINEDYADFLKLSANLVGIDKVINNVSNPLMEVQQQFKIVKRLLDDSIANLENKLAERATRRKQRVMLERLMSIELSLTKIERMQQQQEEMENSADQQVVERMAGEFNHLQFNVTQCRQLPFIESICSRIAGITSNLQLQLQQLFDASLSSRDISGLRRCLRTYSLIDKSQAAESLFRQSRVSPYMEKAITVTKLVGNPKGLDGVYNIILDFIPSHCSLLLDVTLSPLVVLMSRSFVDFNDEPIVGYDFLVSAVWPEIVGRLETQVQSIFAPGDPQAFHKNYLTSMKFVSSFERLCRSQSSVERLRSHPAYKTFMNKWSLPVYFQIRFQEIASQFESILESPFSVASDDFLLQVTSVLWRCLHSCWSDDVFLTSLAHRFWKLSIQLISRFVVWIGDINSSSSRDRTTTDQLVQLINDADALRQRLPAFFTDIVSPKLQGITNDIQALTSDHIVSVVDSLSAVIIPLGDTVVDRICSLCIASLDEAKTIPRLYRHTNREVPMKPSGFVNRVLLPLQSFLTTHKQIAVTFKEDWTTRCLSAVTDRYLAITGDVLTSVKKTEDSLMRLKRTRKALSNQSPLDRRVFTWRDQWPQ
ncbi:conserved oligomeric Golgi complex subunit 2-like isoform X2 [Corticium candelabrum]|uniref:conserved oligomeric Golgi complex subunit 2-like isoform X2 n=1 Tax=Corticium candelabrum TaxID=121492 RepID=UPI002E274238|nr:conserved oligomeric Golgi complex subunit 2-like isoform X2 [Corticium candelabrum]